MAFQGETNSFLLELWSGIHDFTSDTFKLALYTSSASLTEDTTAYSATNEASGTNYSAGGVTLSLASGYPQVVTHNNIKRLEVRFDDATWDDATITDYQYGLIFNSSQSNKAFFVLNFGGLQSVTADTLTINLAALDKPLTFMARPQS